MALSKSKMASQDNGLFINQCKRREEMQNEAGSELFAKEKIWRARIEPPGASLWSWHRIGACAPKFAPDSNHNSLVGGW